MEINILSQSWLLTDPDKIYIVTSSNRYFGEGFATRMPKKEIYRLVGLVDNNYPDISIWITNFTQLNGVRCNRHPEYLEMLKKQRYDLP